MTYPSIDALHELLIYEEESGTLTWKRRHAGMFLGKGKFTAEHRCNLWNARWADQPALNCVASDTGYRVGSVFARRTYAHRAIVAMKTGRWPVQVDHANGNRAENRWSNIREVSTLTQSKNKKRRANNKSGVTGVCWSEKLGRWRVRIGDGGERHVGEFTSFDDAVAARKQAEIDHGYHPNHGR